VVFNREGKRASQRTREGRKGENNFENLPDCLGKKHDSKSRETFARWKLCAGIAESKLDFSGLATRHARLSYKEQRIQRILGIEKI